MLKANVERAGRRGANRSDIANRTRDFPSGVTALTGESRNDHGLFGLRSRLIDAATSAAVSGEPSENLTPRRSAKTAARPPLLNFQLVASSGSTDLPSFESLTSRS